MAAPPSGILSYLNFDGKTAYGTPFWTPVSNLLQMRAIAAELWPLTQNFKMAAAAILDFVESQI